MNHRDLSRDELRAYWMQRSFKEPRRPPRWATLWVPVILSFFTQVPPAAFVARLEADNFAQALLWVGIAALGPIALIFARRFPGPVVAAVALLASLDMFIGDPSGRPYVALAFAIIGAMVRGGRIWAFVSLTVAWAGTITLGLILGTDWPGYRIAGATFAILIAVGLGEAIRSRRAQYSELRTVMLQRERSEVQAERVRIARELHDVLAHSLSQINVQAGVALHLIEKQPEGAATALASIKETSKTALEEVRSVLGVLRAEGGDPDAPLVPEPDLSRLPGLAASVTEQGVEVALDDRIPAAPAPVQLALYRIVQESLTNVLRHASATHAKVALSVDDTAYRVTVTDDGTGATARNGKDGRGLLGMRERAELLGGSLEAARVPTGGFRVAAVIPLRRPETE